MHYMYKGAWRYLNTFHGNATDQCAYWVSRAVFFGDVIVIQEGHETYRSPSRYGVNVNNIAAIPQKIFGCDNI